MSIEIKTSYQMIMDATSVKNGVKITIETGTPMAYAEALKRKKPHNEIKLIEIDDIIKFYQDDNGLIHGFIPIYQDGSNKQLCTRATKNYHPVLDITDKTIMDITEIDPNVNMVCEECMRKYGDWEMILRSYIDTLNEYIMRPTSTTYKPKISTEFDVCAILDEKDELLACTTSDASLKSKLVSMGNPDNVKIVKCVPDIDKNSDKPTLIYVLHEYTDGKIGDVYKSYKTVTNKKGVKRTKPKYHVYMDKKRAEYNRKLKPNTIVVDYKMA